MAIGITSEIISFGLVANNAVAWAGVYVAASIVSVDAMGIATTIGNEFETLTVPIAASSIATACTGSFTGNLIASTTTVIASSFAGFESETIGSTAIAIGAISTVPSTIETITTNVAASSGTWFVGTITRVTIVNIFAIASVSTGYPGNLSIKISKDLSTVFAIGVTGFSETKITDRVPADPQITVRMSVDAFCGPNTIGVMAIDQSGGPNIVVSAMADQFGNPAMVSAVTIDQLNGPSIVTLATTDIFGGPNKIIHR